MQRVLQGIAVVYHPHCSRDEEGKQLDIISTTIPKTALIHSFGSQNVIIEIQHTHPRISDWGIQNYNYEKWSNCCRTLSPVLHHSLTSKTTQPRHLKYESH